MKLRLGKLERELCTPLLKDLILPDMPLSALARVWKSQYPLSTSTNMSKDHGLAEDLDFDSETRIYCKKINQIIILQLSLFLTYMLVWRITLSL